MKRPQQSRDEAALAPGAGWWRRVLMSGLVRWYLAVRTWCGSRAAHLARSLRCDWPAARAGQAFLEYALVIAVVAVIVLVAVQAFGVDLTGVFDRIRSRLGTLG